MMYLKALVLALTFALSAALVAEQPVDINTADAQALADAIKGVGVKRAEAIVSYREENGPFVSIDDLRLVDGIGEKTVDASRAGLTVGSGKD